jgi:hypothetical protein
MTDEIRSETTAARVYPHLDAAVEMGTSPILQRMENTRRELDRTLRTAAGRDKERARAALLAYNRTLDLYRRLLELRGSRPAARLATCAAQSR